jgi:outer membrane protein assembly factor BamB
MPIALQCGGCALGWSANSIGALMSSKLLRVVLAAVLGGVVARGAAADDNWPQWRGPLGTGVGADGDYPEKFSSDEGLAWKIEVPGHGFSTPIVWGDSIFLTSGIDDEDAVRAYDLNGQLKWQKKLGAERPGKHRNASGSNPSPATDGKFLVVHYKSGLLACLDLEGAVVWQKNLHDEFGEDTLWWDRATSPVIVGPRVVVAVMQAGESGLVAFDLATGMQIWKQKRQYERPEESDQAYTTPQAVKLGGKDVVVTWGADHLTGHDADDGKQLWEFDGFNPQDKGMWRVIASATVCDGYAIVPFGRGELLSGIELPADAAAAADAKRWDKQGVGADVPSPAARDGKVYVLGDTGKVTCLDLSTGDERWSSNLPRNRNKYYASPILAGDKLYCAREDGMVFVGRAADEFELLGEGNNMGERIIATPTPVRGGLLIRGEKHLFRVGGEPATAAQPDGVRK